MTLRLVHRTDKAFAFPYSVRDEDNNDIGIGTSAEAAWEDAAKSLDEKLYIVREKAKEIVKELLKEE